MAARKKVPVPTFEERLEALEQVVHDLEGEELSLEASIERYREGVTHLKACRSLLDDAEQRLVELVQEDGEAVEKPLKVTERGLEPDAPRED
jgi:exodeoxyribonuclease VII small subunit